MNVMIVTAEQIRELAEDPNLESIHLGKIISEQSLYCVYDHNYRRYNSITMEPGDEVIITKHRDGTYFMHFMSRITQYHYKAPWVTDEQTTMEDEAIYHV